MLGSGVCRQKAVLPSHRVVHPCDCSPARGYIRSRVATVSKAEGRIALTPDQNSYCGELRKARVDADPRKESPDRVGSPNSIGGI